MKKKQIATITVVLLVALASAGYWWYQTQRLTPFVIKEAGIQIQVPPSLTDMYYVSDATTNPGSVFLSTRRITELDGQCSAQNLSIAGIKIYPNKQLADDHVAFMKSAGGFATETTVQEIDGTYYVFDSGSNTACSDKPEVRELQQKLTADFLAAGYTINKL